LGICGGYQMLGQWIDDPDGIEGPPGKVAGLGHLDVTTRMTPEKRLALTTATYLPTGDTVRGYEIHIGQTIGPDCSRAWLSVAGRPEGAATASGQIRGCYLHGLFAADDFRTTFLRALGSTSPLQSYGHAVEATLDRLADHLEAHLDLEAILGLAADIKGL
jgi:adenosylcobyric acid synthase